MAGPATVLKGSVGFGGKNLRGDVLLVQAMLNALPATRGGAVPALATDGICGTMTNSAIKRFQAGNQCYADGRVDAGAKTERTLLELLQRLGKLAAVLGAAAAAAPAPTGPTVAGPNSPVRRKYVQTAKTLVPPAGLTTGGSGPKGATGCGEFPGRVFARLPVIPPGQPGAFKVHVAGAGTMYLTSPTTWWEQLAQAVDKQHAPARKCWVPFVGGNRPLPGDIYLLAQYDNPAMFQHVGVVLDASGSEWTTCDGGQGNGWQSGIVKRQFQPDGVIAGEFGNRARLKGWVDLDNLYAVAQASFPALG
ncbi:peptidoglycan-binding domain-containing protein [Tabrizicola soli]|uniref:Peptidoglycan-binding protein n=1 Tax=Tabrizicola soli TaxID=2185115 RepID=A0ABV7DY03_9RHOB|nr:peptidoglycan-binding protein [Tabrizicola soli]